MTEAKPISISWIAPNGKNYSDVVNMTLKQYQDFVNGLLEIKRGNKV